MTEPRRTYEPVPKEVATAISQVMAGVKTLGKDDRNQFAKYDFVSTDKFLAAVNPLCAEAGLSILQDEESVNIETREIEDDRGGAKRKSVLTARYAFILAHRDGATWGPMYRTVVTPANGAQAFGTAQSYALKQFMRSLFQISTGDKDDADLQNSDPLPPQKQRMTEFKPPSPAKPVRDPNLPPPDLDDPDMAAGLIESVKACEIEEAVRVLMSENKETLDRIVQWESIKAAAWDRIKELRIKNSP